LTIILSLIWSKRKSKNVNPRKKVGLFKDSLEPKSKHSLCRKWVFCLTNSSIFVSADPDL
jgi:hypothetical protein